MQIVLSANNAGFNRGSYEVQVAHYTKFIKKNTEWEFAGIFADDGISGTNTKKRDEFNRMIAECMDGNIDMVITKSISRFARNTLDCLQYIRQLKDNMIKTLEENIHAVIAETTEYQISEINTLLDEKQKELFKLANKGQNAISLKQRQRLPWKNSKWIRKLTT